MPDPLRGARSSGAIDDGIETYVPLAPVVQVDHILRIQGYSDPVRVRPAIRHSAVSMAVLATELSSPQVAWRRMPIHSLRGDVLELDGGVRFHCDAFARILKGCTEVALVVLTIGPRLDARVAELAKAGELLDALLLESAGWLSIEDATRQFRAMLRKQVNVSGRRITSRMGPGYSYKLDTRRCTWPLDEQIRLFGLLDGATLPVTVIESCAMQPKMSRSGLYGIAPL